MNLFDSVIFDLREFLNSKSHLPFYRVTQSGKEVVWPEDRKGSIVMQSETAVELGSPDVASAAFLAWTENPTLITDSRITLVGKDLADCRGESLSLGCATLLCVKGFDNANCRDRQLEMDLKRFDLSLSGYMMRAVSQHGRQWSRVSRTAIERGFSFEILGGSLMRLYRSLPYVKAVEMVFVTSSAKDVLDLGDIGAKAEKLAAALKKMTEESSFDCDSCEYNDVCTEVESLRMMKKKRLKEKSDG